MPNIKLASSNSQTAAGLVERVSKRGMTLTVEVAESFLREQNYAAACNLGVDERNARQYLDDDTLDELADELVSSFADEAPGSNLFDLPRTAHISVANLGRFIAGLAEAIQFFGIFQEIDDADRRARIHEIAQLLSVAGLVQSDHTNWPCSRSPSDVRTDCADIDHRRRPHRQRRPGRGAATRRDASPRRINLVSAAGETRFEHPEQGGTGLVVCVGTRVASH
ncbi:Uncharacterised protein [Mycolicibacterium vanbaalenii]|uniref:Uncharacterized protein n=1 Tax=Mycolicibacterium vanbaalenii TaxID=110539 RepID=A0A5S9R322_MYCVN|nr:Uncharacterised protein [Mycolicibacterium vanbaalenii]